ncbi:MAG: hypothetical protein ACO25T_07780 [Arenimonas sp.]|uniref:hypothetical protein n=1 Tax=Arenimonas sp. TaxID=1872635 RepID=UPI003BFD5F9D
MKLIARKMEAAVKLDRLRVVRDDGSETSCELPRQGVLPHDLVHAVVESHLNLREGFLGLVAKGADIAFAEKNFREYIDPERHFEVAQAESVVEGLQTQLWQGAFDFTAFIAGVEGACAMRGVVTPKISEADGQAMFDTAVRLNDQWRQVPAKAEFTLAFPLVERA